MLSKADSTLEVCFQAAQNGRYSQHTVTLRTSLGNVRCTVNKEIAVGMSLIMQCSCGWQPCEWQACVR